MDNIINSILVFGILGVIFVFIFFIIKTSLMPKKLGQLENMIKEGQYSLAKKKIKNLLKNKPRYAYYNYLLGVIARKEKNTPLAVKYYQFALANIKSSSRIREEQIRNELALIYLYTKNKSAARKEFLILTKLEPSESNHFYQTGMLFKQDGFMDKASHFFDQAIKINPQKAEYHFNKAILSYQKGEFDKAKKNLITATKIGANLYEAHYYLGLCLRQLKDIEWAIREFDVAFKQLNLKAKVQLMKGLCYLDREQYNKAIEEFHVGLAHARQGSDTYLNILYFLASGAEKIRDFHVAISKWEEINTISPKFKDVAQKLQEYADMRTDDNIKDFLIMSPAQFEKSCKDITAHLGLNFLDIEIINDTEAHVVATESDTKWRNTKRTNRSIYFFRKNEPITENKLRNLQEKMREKSTIRALCLTTGDYATSAETFAQSRPIELVGRSGLIQILKAMDAKA